MRNRFSAKRFSLKKNIYGAIKHKEDGYIFDSKSEWKRYKRLKFEQHNGNISELGVHTKFSLDLGDGKEGCVYTADFTYKNKYGVYVAEDVKSPDLWNDPAMRLKLRMVKAQHNVNVILVPAKIALTCPAWSEDTKQAIELLSGF